MTDKLFRFFQQSIKLIALLPLLALTVLALLFRNTVSFDVYENSVIVKNSADFFLMLPAALAGGAALCPVLRRIPEKILFWGLFFAWLAGGIYLLANVCMSPRADSAICYWNALNYVQGDYTQLKFGEYFYEYPHQLGLVSYNCLIALLSGDSAVEANLVYYANLFWILVGQFFLWRISVLQYAQHPMLRKLIVLLSFAFLPQFFYLAFAYGEVPGLACLLIAVYFALRSFKKGNRLLMLAAMPFMAAAGLLRMNYVIGGVALILVCLLYALRHKKIFFIAAAAGIAVSMTVPKHLVTTYYEAVADAELGNGAPYLLHVAMGLQDNGGSWHAEGWYNGFNHNTYIESGCDTQACKEIAMDVIWERIKTFGEDPLYAVKFFTCKLITTWCDPTYQSIWSGPVISIVSFMEGDAVTVTNVKWLESLYSGGTVYQIYSAGMNFLTVLLFAFTAVYMLCGLSFGKELNPFELFCILFFLGGFLFHFVWETKCQYVYPYMVFLPPLAANGIRLVWNGLKELNSRPKFPKFRMKRLKREKNN